MKEKILERLIEIVKEELDLGSDSDISGETSLFDIGVDSIALMSIIVYTEEEFNYEAEETALIGNQFKCLMDIADYISSKVCEYV